MPIYRLRGPAVKKMLWGDLIEACAYVHVLKCIIVRLYYLAV